MDRLFKWALLVVAVGTAVRAARNIYVGQRTQIPPGYHMHPDGTLMRDEDMQPKPCCASCASGHTCG